MKNRTSSTAGTLNSEAIINQEAITVQYNFPRDKRKGVKDVVAVLDKRTRSNPSGGCGGGVRKSLWTKGTIETSGNTYTEL